MTYQSDSDNHAGWSNVDLTGDPFLILGKRRGPRLKTARLDLHENLFEDFRSLCEKARNLAATTRSRPYEPNAELEQNEEHFDLAVTTSTVDSEADIFRGSRPVLASSEKNPAGLRESSLLANLQHPDRCPVLTRTEFQNFHILFYAICWQQPDRSWISFLRKTNPRTLLKTGRRWCQYGDVLKSLDSAPSFVYDDQIDVIVTSDRIVGFSAAAMKNLFTDVGLATAEVPAYVSSAAESIGTSLPLSASSRAALQSLGQRRVSVAVRLYGLAARLEELSEIEELNSERYQDITGDDEEARKLVVDGEFDFDEDGALVFLDVIEGRYFRDDWTGSARRADRFSRRH